MMKRNLKSLFKAVSLTLATALTLTVSGVSYDALAAEGTVYEAEEAVVEGTPSSGDTFVESQATASGEKSLGYLGVEGNKVIWTFEHEGGEVSLDFVLASGALDWTVFANCDIELKDSVKFYVNGSELSFGSFTLKGTGTFAFDNWMEVFIPATLTAGTNTVTMEIISATAPNVDCLKICAPGLGNTGASAGVADNTPVVTYEAEDAVVEGTPSTGDRFVEDHDTASGGKNVGFLGAVGNKVTWTFEHKGGAATLDFVLASGAFSFETFGNGPMQLKGAVKITLNGKELDFNDITLEAGENYDNWTDVYVRTDLAAGTNTVTLEVIEQPGAMMLVAPNVDCLKVGGPNMGLAVSGGETKIVEKEVIVEKIVKENKYVNVPTPIVKTAAQNIKDVALFSCIICLIILACYCAYGFIRKATMSEEDMDAFKKVKEEKKALKDAFEADYKNVSGGEEKEIARYEYALKRREAKRKAYRDIESLTYGEGKARAKALDIAYGKNVPAHICLIILAACLLGTVIGVSYTGNVVSESVAPLNVTSSLIVTGYDWGPGANKLVLNLPDEVKASDISADMFKVSVTKQGFMAAMGDTVADRTVTDAYTSDEQGNRVKGASKFVTVEMSVDPAKDETNPFHYDFMDTQRNTWANPYTHTVSLVNGKRLRIGKTVYTKLECRKQSKTICPDLNDVTESVVTYDGLELRYASYAPEKLAKDKNKNALIIWLHGMGEGGKDIRINTLGNRVSALWQDEIQKCFDGNGAYVLAPQSPTMWMDNGTGELSTGATASMYEKALWQLITEYVDANPDIDKNRIIIGGCSNGGYMTMNMLLLHPDYFAAAYPCCEAYADANITDAQLDAIKNVPVWFTHAKNDTTVLPGDFTVATYKRLEAKGAKEVHFTFWDDVRDTSGLFKNEDGSAYSYMGHYSWIYLLNNECTDDFDGSKVNLNGKNVTVWQWLAAQSKH